jgi:predicted N-formylglutamate amidohydrolase
MTGLAPLLLPDDPAPYEVVNELGASPFVLACDHAGCVLPGRLGDLGLPASELRRHIGWDLGIADVGRALSARLSAFCILQTYSRLVIDVNRPPGTPESVVTRSERTDIPGNVDVSAEARRAREDAVFWPYHRRIEQELAGRVASGGPLMLVALHSFTPRYKDVARRWHAGVLYGRDDRVARALLPFLRRDTELVVGDNEPYAVSDETDYTVVVHAEQKGIPYIELEIRQDLIADARGVAQWSERLASALMHSFSALFPA